MADDWEDHAAARRATMSECLVFLAADGVMVNNGKGWRNMTQHRDAGWLAQLAEKDRQIQALQAAYEDTRDSLHRALLALAEHDARYRQQVQAKAERYHEIARQP